MRVREKYISKELFERGDELSGYFVERISYYDEKENPIKTIERVADFEDKLYREEFKVVKNYNCSSKRALMALNQEGEFSTTFQGFIKEEPYLYLIVGDNEDKPQSSQTIIDRTRSVLQSQPATMVLVKADRSVAYGNVVGAMVLLQQGGAKDIGFVTDPLESYPIP